MVWKLNCVTSVLKLKALRNFIKEVEDLVGFNPNASNVKIVKEHLTINPTNMLKESLN